MEKVLNFLKKYRDFIYIALLIAAGVMISSQCTQKDRLNDELDRQENNRIALVEELNNYKDELERTNAEKHAYQLTQQELRDSIGLLKKKNKEYLSYINTQMNIRDTVEVETVITKEVEAKVDGGTITIAKSDSWGKSSREFSVDIPYHVDDSKLFTDPAKFALNQSIFVEGWLERDRKTKETFIHLRSDYPDVVFNSGTGIVAENSKAYEREMRRNCGIGIAVGPSFNMGWDLMNKRFVPTVGIGVTIGFTFTPKWAQW